MAVLCYFISHQVRMLNAAIGLNHFYGCMVVNQVVRSISNGCAIRYLRIGT